MICAVGPPKNRNQLNVFGPTLFRSNEFLVVCSPKIVIAYLHSSHVLIPSINHPVTRKAVKRVLFRHILQMVHWSLFRNPNLWFATHAQFDHRSVMPKMLRPSMEIARFLLQATHHSIFEKNIIQIIVRKYFFTGSQATPFTSPECPFRVVIAW